VIVVDGVSGDEDVSFSNARDRLSHRLHVPPPESSKIHHAAPRILRSYAEVLTDEGNSGSRVPVLLSIAVEI